MIYVWCHMPIIPALGKQRQENYELNATFCYLVNWQQVRAV